jgi:hypothetical protein
MKFIAIFANKQVSLPYSSREALEAHNEYRMGELFQLVEGEDSAELNQKVKESLRLLESFLSRGMTKMIESVGRFEKIRDRSLRGEPCSDSECPCRKKEGRIG